MENLSIVYMVAGISSRFQGKIKSFAKITENETLIEYSINQAIAGGFNKIIFIVGNKTEIPFKEKFKNSYKGIPIEYVLQTYDEEKRDRPWGTGDALCTLKGVVNEPFVICNGDDIYGEEPFRILSHHLKTNQDEATLGYRLVKVLPEIGKTHRAIFKVKENYVEDLKETFNIEKYNLNATNNKEDDLCSMNIYALHPKIINLLNEKLIEFKEKNKNDRNVEFLLPTEISNLIKENKIKMKLYKTESKWTGITNPGDEEIVKKEINKN